MNTTQQDLPPKRRGFLKAAIAVLTIPILPRLTFGSSSAGFPTLSLKEPLPADLVRNFVEIAHSDDLAKASDMIILEPRLVNATWDWGGGDFETALGGAAHMGQREMARLLLSKGARIDAFVAAMLGDLNLIKALVAHDPNVVNVPGPHAISLLYHVALSGNVEMAEVVKPYIKETKLAKWCNQSLHAAALQGHEDMTKWLLKNGVDNPSSKRMGTTPLQKAQESKHNGVVAVLKENRVNQ